MLKGNAFLFYLTLKARFGSTESFYKQNLTRNIDFGEGTDFGNFILYVKECRIIVCQIIRRLERLGQSPIELASF